MDNSLDPNHTNMSSALVPSYTHFPSYAQQSTSFTEHSPGILHGYAHSGIQSTTATNHHLTQQISPTHHRLTSPYAQPSTPGTWTGAMPWATAGTASPTSHLMGAGGMSPMAPASLTATGHWPMFHGTPTSMASPVDAYGSPYPYARAKLTTTLWEDEGTMCYQVDVGNYCVARRQDNNMVNGTKLLNVTGMTRGKRDGILKNEKGRHVVKVGAMNLKGVWITFSRAKALATQYKIYDILYPLFADDPSVHLYSPTLYTPTSPLSQKSSLPLTATSTMGMTHYRGQYSGDTAYLGAIAAYASAGGAVGHSGYPNYSSDHSSMTNSPGGGIGAMTQRFSNITDITETNSMSLPTITMGGSLEDTSGNGSPGASVAQLSGATNSLSQSGAYSVSTPHSTAYHFQHTPTTGLCPVSPGTVPEDGAYPNGSGMTNSSPTMIGKNATSTVKLEGYNMTSGMVLPEGGGNMLGISSVTPTGTTPGGGNSPSTPTSSLAHSPSVMTSLGQSYPSNELFVSPSGSRHHNPAMSGTNSRYTLSPGYDRSTDRYNPYGSHHQMRYPRRTMESSDSSYKNVKGEFVNQ
ncbi:hypothetical protein IWQ62_005687 [Dispira parvispora]|uniref:HTH APSES-type domain-containing protein n=1 Tax=Dispira parvispora TaxID=1520584 RepID=A0A9W8E506_9FUNG|nr:hypothetical protein IWQ62_005687 [Dispira parvispora]